jgi:hypothetical protein
MKKLRKNSKQLATVVATAPDMTAYSLDNGFSGKPIEFTPARVLSMYADEPIFDLGNGTYRLRVHGNLWFEFKAGA